MASITKLKSGNWQAKVRRKGQPAISQSFQTKAAAEAWSRSVEREMDTNSFISPDESQKITFREIAERYELEILPSLRGKVQDGYVLKQMIEVFGDYTLINITSAKLSEFRDAKLKVLSPQTVKHQLGMVSRIFKAAILDWNISIPKGNPVANVRKPSIKNDRERRLEGNEEQLLIEALNDCESIWPITAVIFAIETAARQGEIFALTWQDINLEKRTARIRGLQGGITKNDDPYRDIPLSKRATELLSNLPKASKGLVFPITQNAMQLSWERAVRRARQKHVHGLLMQLLEANGFDKKSQDQEIKALIYKKRNPSDITLNLLQAIEADDKVLVDLHFHDLRHEATTRLAEKLPMHQLMKVTGHKSTRMLARYYHPRAEEMVSLLDS
jgi:integrase